MACPQQQDRAGQGAAPHTLKCFSRLRPHFCFAVSDSTLHGNAIWAALGAGRWPVLLWCRLAAPGRQVWGTGAWLGHDYAEGFIKFVCALVELAGACRRDGDAGLGQTLQERASEAVQRLSMGLMRGCEHYQAWGGGGC